jgi:hypothetical protein
MKVPSLSVKPTHALLEAPTRRVELFLKNPGSLLNTISNESIRDFPDGRIRTFVPHPVQERTRSLLNGHGNEAFLTERVQGRSCSLLSAFRNEGARC